ncbi:MAG: SDR family NAD(P)-dependent oxidoreductase, partial [Anaerolineales bacterium]|nr:SDR family NAD(P)-dependent oxidoreductase [Anaerolineales bacterium]
MADWSLSTIPPQEGKVILITGGNSGLGYESALALAQAGATVIISARNEAKGQAALAAIRAAVPGARVELLALNLADLASIRQAAETFRQRYTRLDVLMNNAGVMATPYQKTADGFEMQFGTNHLGHFALTGQLLDLLLNTPESRVVNVSSNL